MEFRFGCGFCGFGLIGFQTIWPNTKTLKLAKVGLAKVGQATVGQSRSKNWPKSAMTGQFRLIFGCRIFLIKKERKEDKKRKENSLGGQSETRLVPAFRGFRVKGFRLQVLGFHVTGFQGLGGSGFRVGAKVFGDKKRKTKMKKRKNKKKTKIKKKKKKKRKKKKEKKKNKKKTRKRKKEKRRKQEEQSEKEEKEQTPCVRLRPIPTSASWPESNWPKSSILPPCPGKLPGFGGALTPSPLPTCNGAPELAGITVNSLRSTACLFMWCRFSCPATGVLRMATTEIHSSRSDNGKCRIVRGATMPTLVPLR